MSHIYVRALRWIEAGHRYTRRGSGVMRQVEAGGSRWEMSHLANSVSALVAAGEAALPSSAHVR